MKAERNFQLFLIFLIFCAVLTPLADVSADPPVMQQYCSTPPFLVTPTPPNILIVLDNSGSMNDQAYAGSYDPTQFVSGNYYGYFDATKNYKYNGTRWEETTEPMTNGTLANPIASGNLLNWATMRRIDVAKKLLIGGKASPRSPNAGITVKLYGETSSTSWNFDKDLDNTALPGLIYPILGNYRYSMSGDSLNITPLVAGATTENVRPNSNVSVAAGWTVFPAATSAWQDVDEAAADNDATYIQNSTTTDSAIFGYKPYVPTIAGSISDVTIVVRARKSASQTRRIRGVLRMKGAAVDVDYTSNTSNLSTTYSNYNFSWATNPQTGLPWQFADLTGSAVGSMVGFGVKGDTNPTASNYYRVTQVYMIVTVANPSGGPYSTIVDQGMVKATGIMDSLSADVKFGLGYYASSSDGGKVDNYVDFGTTTSMITSIHNMSPSTWTPLGETLYEMVRYFRQETPYYGNSPADFQTGLNYDPYYFQYSKIDPKLADAYVPCAKSFILFLTDGESTQDTVMPGSGSGACSLTNIRGCSSGYRFAGTPVGQTYASSGTDYMIDVAFWAKTQDLRPGTCTSTPTAWQKCLPGKQSVTLYSVFMFGKGSTLLKDAAIDGGFDDKNSNGLPDCNTNPSECYRDTDGDGVIESNGQDSPLTYYEGNDGYELERSILDAIAAILKRSASGTAASVLASGEGSGANLIQSIFYPKKAFFNNTEINWVGTLQNLWYYIDPRTANSSIRENTAERSGSTVKELNLNLDKIINFSYDPTDQMTKAQLFSDSNGDGIKDSATPDSTIDVTDLKYLWEAGTMLWSKDASSRNIYTPLNTGVALTNSLNAFTTANLASIRPKLNSDVSTRTATQNNNVATNVINYVRGTDVSACSATDCGSDITYRSRTVPIDLNKDGDASDTVGGVSETAKVWKLGDIVSSTPKISSWGALNNYYGYYNDTTYQAFTKSSIYTSRGMVFAGANDGMLHALKLGTLGFANTGACSVTTSTVCTDNTDCPGGEICKRYELASLSGTNLGTEEWAFIPSGVLPYLQYLGDENYCHLYYVDATPFIFDASMNMPAGCSGDYWNCTKTTDSWRTVLIGGMRLGGACKDADTYTGSYGVKGPTSTNGEGYSSYFALDVTDPANPTLLWEFAPTDGSLGFTTSGPAVVKISARITDPNDSTKSISDTTKNGRWFIVFASGPTGPLNQTYHQLKGYSDQNLKLFVLDLKNGSLVRTIDTGITNAFGSALTQATNDLDRDYQDDVLYLGYTKAEVASPTSTTIWSQGGVLRLVTNEDLNSTTIPSGTALNPNNWSWSYVMTDIGAVTAAIGHLAHYPPLATTPDKLYLYFGTGRYFFNNPDGVDDMSSQRRIFGMVEPCLTQILAGTSCTTSVPIGSLTEASTASGTSDPDGWYINLDPTSGTTYNERIITDPLAATIGAVFFTSFAPTNDICSYGGKSYLWAVRYDTGGAVASSLSGVGLLQVSTGAVEEVNLQSDFTERQGRRTPAMEGVPPTGQGLAIVVPPNPINRILHIRKK